VTFLVQQPPNAIATASLRPSIADDPALGLPRTVKLQILGAVLLALFLGALDQTVVGTALPRIVTDLGGNGLYTWVVTAYLLTSTISIPFWGKLSDIYGRRPLLMIGIGVFLVGSAAAGLSQEMWQLIALRALQGIGAGSLFPISLSVIGDLFAPAERGRYQGLFGAVFGAALLVGPAIGGYLTDQISWHWVFYVNLPVGLASLYVIGRLLPGGRRRGPGALNLDVLGGAFFAIGIGLLLIGLTNLSSGAWTDPSVAGPMAAGLAVTALFVLAETRAAEPIVPLRLWRDRTYAASLLAMFFVSAGFYAAMIFLPRWFQVVRGESATASGYLMFPFLVGVIAASVTTGQIIARTGRYKPFILTGIILMAIGLALLTGLRATTDLRLLWMWMFITGLGVGPSLAAFTIVVQNTVPFESLGVATSNLTFFRQIGGSVGLSVAGSIFTSSLARDVVPSLVQSGVPASVAHEAGRLGLGGSVDLTGAGIDLAAQLASVLPSPALPYIDTIVRGLHAAVSQAVDAAFFVGLVGAAAALVAALALRELPLRGRPTVPPPRHAAGVPSEPSLAAE
jgi:EmrB/QacA subfamily drug resistance transporter